MLIYGSKIINEVSIMLNIEIYEEAMCCSTGVCGPEPDETLIKTNQINEYLEIILADKKKGSVAKLNL